MGEIRETQASRWRPYRSTSTTSGPTYEPENTTGWQRFPSYLDRVVPPVLELLAERGLQITFFVVGQDAELSCARGCVVIDR